MKGSRKLCSNTSFYIFIISFKREKREEEKTVHFHGNSFVKMFTWPRRKKIKLKNVEDFAEKKRRQRKRKKKERLGFVCVFTWLEEERGTAARRNETGSRKGEPRIEYFSHTLCYTRWILNFLYQLSVFCTWFFSSRRPSSTGEARHRWAVKNV